MAPAVQMNAQEAKYQRSTMLGRSFLKAEALHLKSDQDAQLGRTASLCTTGDSQYVSLVCCRSTVDFSDADLDEFIAIYKEEFGEEIGCADASEMASRLVILCALLSRQLPEQKYRSTSVRQPEEEHLDDRRQIGFRT